MSGFANPTTPNLPDFAVFVTQVMQINSIFLPNPPTPALTFPFYRGRALVIAVPCGDGYDYTNAVYNCAGHILIATAQDQNGRTFFRDQRASYSMSVLAAGVVQSTSDSVTSTALAVPDGLANLTISDLGFFKTPWGRAYLEFNQDFGGLFGIT